MSIRRPLLLVLCFGLWVAPEATFAGKVYWYRSPNVLRANLNGVGVEAVLPQHAPHLAVDLVNGKMYWALFGVKRANLDGTGVELLVVDAASLGNGIAVDPGLGRIYWTEPDAGLVRRANLDGSGAETVVSGPLEPRDVAIDPGGGRIYWTESAPGGPNRVWRADLDGTNAEILAPGLTSPEGIALDVAAQQIYWAYGQGVRRMNYDGTGSVQLVSGHGGHAVALDLTHGKLYWTETGANDGVYRADLDGSNTEAIFNTQCVGCMGGVALVVYGECGDGVVQPFEECDDGNQTDGDGCQSECVLPRCGDGILDAGEECDDANDVSCDGCSAICLVETGFVCGDGVVDPDCGEECDDGNAIDGDGCQGNCLLPVCGDGILDPGEECDDGNQVHDDGCEQCKVLHAVPAAGRVGGVLIALVVLACIGYLVSVRRRGV